ncbi:MAG: ABC transporter permease [Alphaproteobacteria bacterium]|nr:ABC transporter permease [Alphaproteobacteria bacterium]
MALRLALSDVYSKYQRTILGPMWIVLGQAATIAGFVVVFSGLFKADPETYALYLAAGIPVWTLISSYLVEMPATFIQTRGFIESFELPWLTQIWRRSITYVVIFLHQLIPLIVVMIWLSTRPGAPNVGALFHVEMLYVIPALLVVMVAGTGIGIVLAVFGARYRDLQPAMGIVSSFLFFVSPVMWRAEQLDVNQWVVRYNPFHYIIDLVREPLLGRAPSIETWLVAIAVAFGLMIFGFVCFAMSRRRLYYWM